MYMENLCPFSLDHSLFRGIRRSVEVVHDPHPYLSWPKRSLPLEEEREETQVVTGEAGEIQLRPVGPVRVPIEEQPPQTDDNSKLITSPPHELTPLASEGTEPAPVVCQLECGNAICKFEFALYEFIWKPPITHAPPRPPSSSSESPESSMSEEEVADTKEEENGSVKDEAGEKRPPKVLNTEANVNEDMN